jgi:hypothetical protein
MTQARSGIPLRAFFGALPSVDKGLVGERCRLNGFRHAFISCDVRFVVVRNQPPFPRGVSESDHA